MPSFSLRPLEGVRSACRSRPPSATSPPSLLRFGVTLDGRSPTLHIRSIAVGALVPSYFQRAWMRSQGAHRVTIKAIMHAVSRMMIE